MMAIKIRDRLIAKVLTTYAFVRKRARASSPREAEARASETTDCNFTHDVTRRLATLRLTPRASSARTFRSIPLGRSVTQRRLFRCFCSLYERNHPPWSERVVPLVLLPRLSALPSQATLPDSPRRVL